MSTLVFDHKQEAFGVFAEDSAKWMASKTDAATINTMIAALVRLTAPAIGRYPRSWDKDE
jgi:hypothetical protein